MNAGNMNRSIKKRYITWLLSVLNIFSYTFFKCILCPNKISVSNVKVSFYHGYKCGVNDLKVSVIIFVY